MQKFKIKREWYSEHFKTFLGSKNRYQILWGGRGGGKTHNIILKLVAISFLNEYNHIIYVNKVLGDIRKNQFKDIIKVLKATQLIKYFRINRTNYGFTNIITGTEFTALGMDNAENTKGLSDPTIIWWDEINKGNQDDFTTLNALLRTPLNDKHSFIISFNPVDERNWLRSYFFDENDNTKIRSDFKDIYVNHSTFVNNEYIDRDKYEETLRLNYSYNPNLLSVNMDGKWGRMEIKSPWLYSWQSNRDKIIADDLPYYDSLPIYVSFDFNNDPLSCIVAQHSSGNHNLTANPFIHILKEYQTPFKGTVQNPFIEIRHKLMQDFNNPRQIFITGDANGFQGRMGLVDGSRHFYDLILKTFNLGEYHLKTPLTNPLHTASRHNFNTLIHYHPMFKISKKGCPNLINDMDIAEATDKNGKGDELLKDRKENKMDLFDAERYYLWTFFNTFK